MGHINKFKTRYYLLITIIVLGVIFRTSNAYADDVLNLRSVAYNGNKYNYYTDSIKFHTPANGYEVLLREIYPNNYYVYREIGPGVTDNISENHKAKGYGNYIFEPKTNLYKFLEWCYAKDQSMTEQACIVNGESENKSCTYEKLKGNSGKAINNEIRKFMNAFWINMQTLLSDKFNQYQDEYFFEKYVVKGLNAVGMSLGRIRQVQKNEDEEESAREYLTCMSSYMFSHTWEIAAPDTYTVEKGDVVPFLYYKLQVDETNPKELARYAYISLIEGWCTSLNGKHMWREEYEAQYGPYNEEEYDLEELKIWYDDCWQKYSKKRGKKGNNLLGADITVIIQSDYSIEYQLEATEYYLDKTFEDLGIERSYKENIARNNLMAEYMMQDSGLTETIKEYSVSIKFLEENLQRGTFEEKNTNTAVLSDYQFIKFNHPLNEDGHSDNDTLSDLTELTRNYKWMDITEFVRKTYENLIASGNSVKETFEKQVDDIIYKNGNSDQVEDSGHIKKVTDADGSIKVLYRTYDYASNPVLEDTDFDGLRDDQDKLKLNNTFKGSSDDIGNVEYVNDFRWFYTDPNKYNDELAVMSLMIANGKGIHTQQTSSSDIVQYLKKIGFEDIAHKDRFNVYGAESIEGKMYIGKKTIQVGHYMPPEKEYKDVYGIFLMDFDNEGSAKHLLTNFNIDEIELLYENIARDIDNFIDIYLNKFPSNNDSCFWLTGYSMAGGIVSFIAPYLIGRGETFAYTFGAPAVTNEGPTSNESIKNIINEDDLIPKVLNSEDGYTRVGAKYNDSIYYYLRNEYANLVGSRYAYECNPNRMNTLREKILNIRERTTTIELANRASSLLARYLMDNKYINDSFTMAAYPEMAVYLNPNLRKVSDAHNIKSYYVLAKNLNGYSLNKFDALWGGYEEEPESDGIIADVAYNKRVIEAINFLAQWYINHIPTYQNKLKGEYSYYEDSSQEAKIYFSDYAKTKDMTRNLLTNPILKSLKEQTKINGTEHREICNISDNRLLYRIPALEDYGKDKEDDYKNVYGNNTYSAYAGDDCNSFAMGVIRLISEGDRGQKGNDSHRLKSTGMQLQNTSAKIMESDGNFERAMLNLGYEKYALKDGKWKKIELIQVDGEAREKIEPLNVNMSVDFLEPGDLLCSSEHVEFYYGYITAHKSTSGSHAELVKVSELNDSYIEYENYFDSKKNDLRNGRAYSTFGWGRVHNTFPTCNNYFLYDKEGFKLAGNVYKTIFRKVQ